MDPDRGWLSDPEHTLDVEDVVNLPVDQRHNDPRFYKISNEAAAFTFV